MSDTLRFRLLVARTDVDGFCVVLAMDETVIDVAGEDEWDDAVSTSRDGWPDEYDYAAITVAVPTAQIHDAFPKIVEIAGSVAPEGETT